MCLRSVSWACFGFAFQHKCAPRIHDRIFAIVPTRPPLLCTPLRTPLTPTPAIDQVLFMQNTSPVPDEMLAHRLGMVPLVSQNVMDGLRYTRVSQVQARVSGLGSGFWALGSDADADVQDCECDEGCYYCMIQLRLRVSNKHGQRGAPMAVTSDMLEVVPSPNDVSQLQRGAGVGVSAAKRWWWRGCRARRRCGARKRAWSTVESLQLRCARDPSLSTRSPHLVPFTWSHSPGPLRTLPCSIIRTQPSTPRPPPWLHKQQTHPLARTKREPLRTPT